MNEKYLVLGILIVFLAVYIVSEIQVSSEVSGATINYNSEVCIYKNDELVQCSPNTVTTAGLNWIRDLIGNWTGGDTSMKYIAVANNTDPAAHDPANTTMTGEESCCGLERAEGAYAAVGGKNGNWTISKVFTANASISEVNATGLFNASASGTYFAYNTFTPVNLQANDQLNITWNIWVT